MIAAAAAITDAIADAVLAILTRSCSRQIIDNDYKKN
jgi:hypothetical protein